MDIQIDKTRSPLAFGAAAISANQTNVNGDAYFIKEWDNHVLLALIDGLGHGEEAAIASTAAKQYISENFKVNIAEIMSGVHGQLQKTRGAAIALARIDFLEKQLIFCGVGNVEVRVLSEPEMHPTSVEGVVGMNKIRVKQFKYSYNNLEAVALWSDGISSKFDLLEEKTLSKTAQQTADGILSMYWNLFDDATIIVALGEPTYH